MGAQPRMKAYLPSPVPTCRPGTHRWRISIISMKACHTVTTPGSSFNSTAWRSWLHESATFGRQWPQLKIAFPAGTGGRLPLQEILRRIEGVSPGFTDALGSLSGPSTIRRLKESSCLDSTLTGSVPALLVIDNRTSQDVMVVRVGADRFVWLPDDGDAECGRRRATQAFHRKLPGYTE